MKTIELGKVYIFVVPKASWEKEGPDDKWGFEAKFENPRCYTDGAVQVKEIDIEFEVPDNFDPSVEVIEALKKEITEAAEYAETRGTDITRVINTLLALPAPPADE